MFKTKKILILILLLALFMNFVPLRPALADGEVLFDCENLAAALREATGKEQITEQDMQKLSGTLDLSYKNITSIKGLEYAVNVRDFVLSFNNITDITPIMQLSNLQSLYLDYNWIKKLPDIWTGLVSLEHLDISNNEIAEIPAAFADLPKLRRLYAGDMQLKTPPGLTALADTLDRLDISGAMFEDFSFVEGLTNLELLMMNGCGLQSLPDLSRMSLLGYLYFADNRIASLPDYLGSLPLIRLDFSANLVSQMPQSFTSLTRLEQLVMTDNYFEALPETVVQMESLEVLMCGQNIISDVPQNLGDLKNIKRASFASNDLLNLYKFTEFDIPYSYQISFDLNRIDLADAVNADILKDYRNDGGVQKTAQLSAQATKADTESLVVQCSFDMSELERLGKNAQAEKLMLFRRENGAIRLAGQAELSEGQAELTVSQDAPPQGAADYLVCLVINDGNWPGKYVKYTAELTGVNIAAAPTPQPSATMQQITAAPTPAQSAAPQEQKGPDTKILLYILALGVIIIITAIVIHFVFYRRK